MVAAAKLAKDIKAVGPGHIVYDSTSGLYSLTIPGPLENIFYCQGDEKLIQFYISERPDVIEYGANKDERVNVK